MVNGRQSLDLSAFARASGGDAVEWLISDKAVPYPVAVEAMEARVADIAAGRAPELVWLLEHPSLYTSGTSGKAADLLDAKFPIFDSGRGGQLTYHGPGQRVAYVMLDLRARGRDVRAFVARNAEKLRKAGQENDLLAPPSPHRPDGELPTRASRIPCPANGAARCCRSGAC